MKPLIMLARSSSLSSGQSFSTTVLVSEQHYLGGDLTTDQMTSSMENYRKQTLKASLVYSSHVDLNGLDFAYLEMKHDLTSARGTPETYESVQYIYVKNREVYIIEFTTNFDRASQMLPLFKSIALTFVII